MEDRANIVHKFDSSKNKSNHFFTKEVIIISLIAIVLGSATGFFVSGMTGGSISTTASDSIDAGDLDKGEVVGSENENAFKDQAEGVLKEGGLDGEGQYHLERPGGESQNVYLTSSVIDLSEFEGKKVKVWGATFEAQKAGWLMDVGRVQLME